MLVFLIPALALAVDQREPNASPPDAGLAAPGVLTEEAPWAGFAWADGTWTEVK